MKTVFLSGLGLMGRRHLKGLLRAGARVVAFDPDPASHAKAEAELAGMGLPAGLLKCVVALPSGKFDAAVFSETANWRHSNVAQFLKCGRADRILLEKPLSSNPAHVEAYVGMFEAAGVPLSAVSVNFPRRLWSITDKLRELAAGSIDLQMTINGGAFGLGCNGIHYLDAFLLLAGVDRAEIQFCIVDKFLVASGRGPQFADYGGRFSIRAGNANLYCATSANSSAPVMVTIRGDHFLALVDETNLTWKVIRRSDMSNLPNYRYGADYEVIEQGPFHIDALDLITQRWIEGEAELASMTSALSTHRLLHEILVAGGSTPPFNYT